MIALALDNPHVFVMVALGVGTLIGLVEMWWASRRAGWDRLTPRQQNRCESRSIAAHNAAVAALSQQEAG